MNKLIDKELGVIQTDMETASGDIIEHPWVGAVSTEEDIERDYEYQREQFYKLVDRGSVAIDGNTSYIQDYCLTDETDHHGLQNL